MTFNITAVVLVLFLLTGCGLSGVATRKLSQAEQDYLIKVQDRVRSNGESINKSLGDLLRLSTSKAEDEHSLALSISKAKLLESMKAPWANPTSAMAATQKAVILYHLYDLAEAEHAVVEAQIRERHASVQAVMDAYGDLATLFDQAIESQKLILAYLNQPTSARLSEFTQNFLVEANAFRNRLATSENPELKALAERTARASERVAKAKDQIDRALEAIAKVKEK